MTSIKIFLLLGCIALMNCSTKSVSTATATPSLQTRVVNVATATQLKTALLNAIPGDDIILADGVYTGKFVIGTNVSGASNNPITLRGSRNAVLDGNDVNSGYVLHVQSSYWNIKGFTIKSGNKGLMADGVNHVLIDGLKVTNIGQEGIHLRTFSSNNTIQNCEITYTGVVTADYGEGIYIGTAKSNWATITNGAIDNCDSNKVLNNKIGPYVAAECIDIKEGTTGGLISGNTFDAQGIQGANSADSWIDVKGNYYLIQNNTGNNYQPSALLDGYQVNAAYSGWGCYNEFKNNVCNVNAAGHGFNIRLTSSNGNAVGNKVYTSNTVNGAASGVSNIPLTN